MREHDTVELARPVVLDWLVLEKAGGDRLMKPAGRLGEVPEIHKHELAPEAGQQVLERSILRRLQSDYLAAHGVPCLSLVSGKSNCVHLPAKRLKRYVAHRLDAWIEVDVDRGRFMQRVEGGGPYDDSPSPVSISQIRLSAMRRSREFMSADVDFPPDSRHRANPPGR